MIIYLMSAAGSDITACTSIIAIAKLVICKVMKIINTYRSYWTLSIPSWWFLIIMQARITDLSTLVRFHSPAFNPN